MKNPLRIHFLFLLCWNKPLIFTFIYIAWKIALWITFEHLPGLWKSQGGAGTRIQTVHQLWLRMPPAIRRSSGSVAWKLHPDPHEYSPQTATFLWGILIAVNWYFQIMNFGKFQSFSVCEGPVEGRDSKKANPKRGCNSPFSETKEVQTSCLFTWWSDPV